MTEPTNPSPSQPPHVLADFGQRVKNFVLKALLLLLLLIVVGTTLYGFAAYYYVYSSGQVVGVVQKLSNQGWLCKTWEGVQLLTITQSSPTMPEKFFFTVRDPKVVEKINASMGREVILFYDQHRGLPSCFGNTENFVTDTAPATK